MEPTRDGTQLPLVSVVIPTVGRWQWLRQAVQSVLSQTYRNCEVVVVDDSPDACVGRSWSYEWGLKGSERVRLIRSGGVGGGAARNAGVDAAQGQWIAFLDDDDEWMPEKLEKQMEVALGNEGFPVVSCRVKVKTPRSEYVFPRHVYRGDESIAEYLFCRKGWAKGGGFLQTSTLLAPRVLLLRTRFKAGLLAHQDWDWLLCVSREPDVNVHMLEEALAVYRTGDCRDTVSQRPDWRFSLNWIRGHAFWIDPSAVSWFIAVQCVWKARAAHTNRRDWKEIVWAFFYEGRPTLGSVVHFAAFALVPVGWRKGMRDMVWSAPCERQRRTGRQEWKLVSR